MANEKPRVYGRWAGNPIGVTEKPANCVESLWDRFYPGGRQCTRKRGHGPNGEYCKQHAKRLITDPSA